MLRLSEGEKTVPQIFFNERHVVGGNAGLEELLSSGRLQELIEYVRDTPPPTSTSTEGASGSGGVPTLPSSSAREDGNGYLVRDPIRCEADEYNELAQRMHQELVGTKWHMLRPHEKVMVGSEAVDWLVKNSIAPTREAAVHIGQRMVAKHFFHHVYREHNFEDGFLFFR